MHLSSFKASMIETKQAPVEMNESLQTVMDQIQMWRAVELLQSKSSLRDKFASTMMSEKMSVIDEESDVRSKLFSSVSPVTIGAKSGQTTTKFGISPYQASHKRRTSDFCKVLTVNLDEDFLMDTCESPRAVAIEVRGNLR